ncbi:MAG: gliding motility-associated C-terminal domain-containing protein [Bacteroidales bacterium]|nr:gliding motility-associated C-terminal domain-containing protein [Bacteroidales bacterium]MCF8443110.1 gliding motility-associated C-terminal domain-containing protein [Saprospiraceae bacterium]
MVFSNSSDNIPGCFTGGIVDRDVWFMFTVPPDGSVVDFTITVTGVNGPNGSINQPQLAVYRGDCELDGLQELNCATSAFGEDIVEIDLLGLTPGLPYFLRVSDWTASGTPNWGDFVFCISEYVPVFNMGDDTFTAACAGTLYDSGGPTGDYGNSENYSFTVCPQDFTQCIFVDVQNFSTEVNFDFLTIYIGDDTNAPQLTNLEGFGSNVQLQVYGQCVTFQFTSDGSFTDSGFELTWQCSPDTCTVPPPSTCDNPTVISTLPYTANDMTTCNAANAVNSSPCNNSDWLDGDDVIFTYTSPGDECIGVSLTGTNNATAVGIFDACPNVAGDCIAVAGGGNGQANPSINGAFLELPGTYYIVVDNPNSCTPFNIEVTQVTCPIVLPSAADCDDAIGLNGCGDLPAIISVAPGQGDASVIQDGINEGCWGFFTPNFTWFFFQAQEDGNFGFTMQATNPAEASDIDFQVWGPVTNVSDLCTFAYQNQPIRSSYAAGADPTGLADIHPILNTPVTDVCETAIGDDFVSTIPVQTGEFYVVLINDWGGQITSGAVSIDFGNTSPGVLDNNGTNFMASPDTVLCPGESTQLLASGGELYQWFPAAGLSCVYCPNPVATVSQSTVYHVAINSLCNADTLEVEVGLLQVDAGPDLTVCLNEDVQIIGGSNYASVTYAWNAPAGFLSCTVCPDPIVTANQPGTFTLTVTATGSSCSFSDEMTLTVLPNIAPSYQISDDQSICFGETVNLGGTATPNVVYSWTSSPVGFVSTVANPSVSPTTSTTYYLATTNGVCPLTSFDSLTVTVSALPIINTANDTTICQGQSLVLGSTTPEAGVVYQWSPSVGLNNANVANPMATPAQTTSYVLTANRLGCDVQETVNVTVTPIAIDILAADTIPICKGVSVPLSANAIPTGTTITWAPNDGSLNLTTGPNVVASPQTATSYIASVTTAGCTRFDTIYIGVDSLPWVMNILPADTTICQGEQVLLTSPLYEPGDFSQIEFLWTPALGQLTPDSFYNMVVQPVQTTTYLRAATNGFCSAIDSSTITVITVTSIQITPEQPIICLGSSVQLTATAPVPIDFSWEPVDGLSCTDCPNPIASPSQSITYTVSGDFMGCPLGGTQSVEVVAQPFIQAEEGPLCPGDSIGLNGSPQSNWSYLWSSPDDPNFSSTAPSPIVSPSQTTNYVVTVDNGVCPPETFQMTLTVSDNPSLTLTPDTVLCDASSIQLFADSGEPGGNYLWSNDLTGSNIIADLIVGDNLFTVTYWNACGDTLTGTVLVELVPGIDVSIVPTDTNTYYQGTVLNLSTTTSQPAASYQWSNGSISDTANLVLLNFPLETIYVTVTDDLGCSDVDSLRFNVLESKFDIPNAFTPNGDSKNDTFRVVILGENIKVISMNIWNRWGQQVFEEKNSNIGWDGNQGSEPAPSDVYIYRAVIIRPDGTRFVEKGDMTLLR